MDQLAVTRARLEQASGLPAILDAAYDAFEDLLSAVEDQQDPDGGGFAAFVMSGAAAANGRDAVAGAPSLPLTGPGDAARPKSRALPLEVTAVEAVAVLARFSHLLASRLADARVLAVDIGDRAACADASRYAAEVCSLLGGAPDQ